jgi:hypothetical protein
MILIKNSAIPKTALFIFAMLLLSLFLYGCGGSTTDSGSKVKDTDYYVGSEGLTVDLLNDNVLDEIYENSSFSVNVLIENNGAHDILGLEQAYVSLSFDPFYISATPPEKNENLVVKTDGSTITVKAIQLFGKSKYFPAGEDIFFSFANLQTKSVAGQRSMPETEIMLTLCYPYSTVLSKLICVDLNSYRENLRKQVCTQKDLSQSDQGAPLAITLVEVENQPVAGDLVRPSFVIHVVNRGRGTVLSPAQDPAELDRVCTAADLRREDFNTVNVEAVLSQALRLKCNPEVIRLFNDEGFTRCYVKDEDLNKVALWRQNYETPLSINLSYVYQESLSKQIEIKRFDVYGGVKPYGSECQAYEIKINGQCVSRCSYCAEHSSDASCQPAGAKYTIAFDKGFDCKCSSTTCNKLYPDGLCVPFVYYCPSMSFCCSAPCPSNQIKRLLDGKCYPKCSECSNITRSCLCKESDAPVSSGFCCPAIGVSATNTECKTQCQNATV